MLFLCENGVVGFDAIFLKHGIISGFDLSILNLGNGQM